MLPEKFKIMVLLQFDEEMMNDILAYKYQGADEPPKVTNFTEEQIRNFALELQGSSEIFTQEIVESCKQDDPWLVDFVKQFEKK